jgi:hypothetical protein
MTRKTFRKLLSANDVGNTGSHMAGILVPKGEGELLAFLPPLDPAVLNPSAWIDCVTEEGLELKFRYIYYNNKFHAPNGTRNEYRITHMTKYLRDANADESDVFEISREGGIGPYYIRIIKAESVKQSSDTDGPVRIKLSGWRRIH